MEQPAPVRLDHVDGQFSPSWRLVSLPRVFLSLTILLLSSISSRGDGLESIRAGGLLRYGTDAEGGAPYLYPDPDDTSRTIGFEKELMDVLGDHLGVEAQFVQGNWDRLLQNLATGRVHVVCNGYELIPSRLEDFLATRPYFVYQLQLMGRRGGDLRSWDTFRKPKPEGGPWRIGVLTNSVADRYVHELAEFYESKAGTPTIEVARRDSVVDAIREVQNGQLDATLQDDIAARFYLSQELHRDLRPIGPPQGGGYYTIYVAKQDEALHEALDRGLERLIESGKLREILERYEIWSPAQEELLAWDAPAAATYRADRGAWATFRENAHFLVDAAWITVVLSCAAMPLAMAVGLGVAVGRMYGPAPLRWLLTGYVELIRGTPLMLQLFFIYFLLPTLTGIALDNLVAGILGLAINYSAYEAEIYRTGLQAVPRGQMEAAKALGMSGPTALRRIILPQAGRIVIPPVTSDFITLLKDSSVCSVIGLVELSKQYSILVNNNGHVVLFAAVVAAIYLAMSLPLARLAHLLERRLDAGLTRGNAA